MFTKHYEVTIESRYTMKLVRVLGHYGVRFEVGDECAIGFDPDHKWFRTFIIHATGRKMNKIKRTVSKMK